MEDDDRALVANRLGDASAYRIGPAPRTRRDIQFT
jgi:hypothetical protein